MNAVAYADRANAWAVGNQGNILRLKYGKWDIFPSATDQNLYAVFAQGSNDAWAVGAEGTIMHWNGDRWAVDAASGVATLLDLYAVAFLNEDNGWAAGGGAGGGVVLHYDGSSWTVAQTLTYTVTGIAAVSSDYIWFCGYDRKMTLFNGTVFTPGPALSADGQAWRAISFPYRRLGWMVGDDGTIARFSPSKYPLPAQQGWGLYTSPTLAPLRGVCVLPDPEWGYAVGAGGIRLRLDDDAVFRQEAVGGAVLNSIDLANHEEGGAVGGTVATGPRVAELRTRTTQEGFANARVFPSPFEPVKGGKLSIDRLPGNVSSIEIFSMEGDKVASIGKGIEYRAETGWAKWDGRIGGKLAASGAYMARLSAPGVKSRMMTFLLVKR
jgi:hypothetical protein